MTDGHGTGVSATAGAPANGVGIRGIWPGMRLLSIALPEPSTCSDSVSALDVASRTAGVRAINMSYGHEGYCFPEELGVGYAFAAGEVPVAAAGNEFQEGNPLSFPAVLPHVVTVAATKQDFTSADFSSSNAGVDISAPGVGIVTAWPARFDDDGRVDGYQSVNGTSFSSPMVAAAATWIKAARPSLGPGQISDVLRASARDIWRPGYDTDTGFGLLNIPGALAARTPRVDPLEPNDEIYWIDGRAFRTPDPFLWNGQSFRSIHGTIDTYEDTFDVYRIRLRPRGRVTIAADPEYGDPVLFGFRSSAKSVYSSASRLFRINRHGEGGTEGVTVANGSRRSYLNAYIAVSISGSARTLDSAYSLRFTRRSSLR
jgi:hypothetical protein